MVTARLGQMVTLSPRRLAEQPLRSGWAGTTLLMGSKHILPLQPLHLA
jgi:hypothetical protein